MNSQIPWGKVAIGTLLLLSLCVGVLVSSDANTINDGSRISITVCDDANEYDFTQTLQRVEKIKGMRMERNLTVCTEQTVNGIDTTSNERRFAYLRNPGLSFFELQSRTDTGKRTSIGYTTFSPNGGPIQVTLASESTIENISWTSYDALVAHEFSHAIDNSHLHPRANGSTRRVEVRRTTDWLLANRALSEGSAVYVSELYVQRYGGDLNVSKLGEDSRGWKHQILVSMYSEGYQYSRNREITSSNEQRVNSTAAILHPARTEDPDNLPTKANLSVESTEHIRTDRIGELFIRGVLRSKGLDFTQATNAAEGWTNDRLDYYRGDGFNVVTWRIAWQTERDRSEFLSAYDAAYEYTQSNSVASITCEESGRYLVTSEKTVTVVSCSD